LRAGFTTTVFARGAAGTKPNPGAQEYWMPRRSLSSDGAKGHDGAVGVPRRLGRYAAATFFTSFTSVNLMSGARSAM
jgi:hypothetical protein